MSLVFEWLFLSQTTTKILSRISLKHFRMLVLSSSECSCQHGVINGHTAASWVDECCSELGTPSTIPKSDTKEYFVGMFYECCWVVNGEKWQSWCRLEVVAVSEGKGS